MNSLVYVSYTKSWFISRFPRICNSIDYDPRFFMWSLFQIFVIPSHQLLEVYGLFGTPYFAMPKYRYLCHPNNWYMCSKVFRKSLLVGNLCTNASCIYDYFVLEKLWHFLSILLEEANSKIDLFTKLVFLSWCLF